MTISLLIPCHNEERAIRKSILSWLRQTRPADQIVVVDDSSTDRTPEILKEFEQYITIIRTPQNLGNKSYAQEYGLQFITGEVFISTDADTLLKEDFIELIEKDFDDPKVAAVGGYVKSLKNNWLTRHRAFEYAIGQNFHKVAQSYINFIPVIPGAAGAFRTEIFKRFLTFDHDTITEDLDFTYKLHKKKFRIHYDRQAIVYTQDPATLHCYINQMRRWFGGGWQNLMKHYAIAMHPVAALELSLMYIEGIAFAMLMFLVPLINIRSAVVLLFFYFIVVFCLSVFASIKERRLDLLTASVPYILILYITTYLFLEQFIVEVVLRKKNLMWFSPQRQPDL